MEIALFIMGILYQSEEGVVMFVLSEMQDTVRIEPHRFSEDMGQELSDELNKKFANKVNLAVKITV